MSRNRFFNKSLLFDYTASILATFLLIGAYTDAWAHHHIPTLETFFTPWHGVLYGSFALNALFLGGLAFLNFLKHKKISTMLPPGYFLSLIGVIIFLVGGVGDMFWHIAFGIEKNIDALYSPTHLILAVGAFLIVTGPLRAGLQNSSLKSFFQKLPMILSLTVAFSVLTFFTQASHPLVQVHAGTTAYAHELHMRSFAAHLQAFEDLQARGIESIIIQSAILMGLVFYMLRRTKLPTGTFPILLGINTIFLSVLEDHYVFIPIAIGAGILIDILYRYLQPNPERKMQMRWFGFVAPALFYSIYFVVVLLTEGTPWTIHMVTGSIAMAGVTGLLLSFVAF